MLAVLSEYTKPPVLWLGFRISVMLLSVLWDVCVSALLELLQVMSHSCLCHCCVQVSECFEYRGHV